MDFQSLIGYDVDEAMQIIAQFTSKKIIKKDNNSNVPASNSARVVRIKEYNEFIEIISSDFNFLN